MGSRLNKLIIGALTLALIFLLVDRFAGRPAAEDEDRSTRRRGITCFGESLTETADVPAGESLSAVGAARGPLGFPGTTFAPALSS
jgi:hypothetical protein